MVLGTRWPCRISLRPEIPRPFAWRCTWLEKLRVRRIADKLLAGTNDFGQGSGAQKRLVRGQYLASTFASLPPCFLPSPLPCLPPFAS